MRLREARDGELTIYSREEWERCCGPLPAAFKGDKVYIDKRFPPECKAFADGDKVFYLQPVEELLPQGIRIGSAHADDLRLAAEILARMDEAEALQ